MSFNLGPDKPEKLQIKFNGYFYRYIEPHGLCKAFTAIEFGLPYKDGYTFGSFGGKKKKLYTVKRAVILTCNQCH